MATITKTLKNSGGDFNSFDDISAWVDTNMKVGGPNEGDTLVVNAKGGQNFLTSSGVFYIDEDTSGWACSGKVIIQTDPADATLESLASFVADDGSTVLTVAANYSARLDITITGIKLKANTGSNLLFFSGQDLAEGIVSNCVCVLGGVGAILAVSGYSAGNRAKGYLLNTIIVYNVIPSTNPIASYTSGGGAGYLNVSNNTIVSFKNSATFPFRIMVSSGVLNTLIVHNNCHWNYGTGNVTTFTIDNATNKSDVGNFSSDPMCTEQLIQSELEDLDTVFARNFKQVGGSPLIDAADPTYATATDIFGTTRT